MQWPPSCIQSNHLHFNLIQTTLLPSYPPTVQNHLYSSSYLLQLELFAGASGLITNLEKCLISPIGCTDEEIALVQTAERVPVQAHAFPSAGPQNLGA
jgi:hypothetical protein